jgi:hypothetical protein
MMAAVVGIVTAINIGNRHLTNPPRLAQPTRTLKREPRRPLPSFSQPQQNDLSASSGFTRSAPLQPPTETDDIPQARQNAAIESRIPTSASPAPSTPPVTSDVEAPDHNPPQTKNLEKRITKAISARAVYGVSVSFSNNVVNLEGTVKTDNQKAAAEQAARKIIGARELKNSISVEWSQENG